MRDTLNDATLTSVELNKTFRLDRYHHGGWGEPFFGLRYILFKDFTIKDNYIGPYDVDGGAGFGTIMDPLTGVAETLLTDATGIENNMIGAQIGFRYFRNRRRWKLSSDVRFLALQNFQEATFRRLEQTTLYDAIAESEEPTVFRFNETKQDITQDEFVYGIDVRAEAAYELTRDFSFRVGLQYMHFARGVWRGNNPNYTSQDLMLIGATVGATLNR
jgi:hypothetical protein